MLDNAVEACGAGYGEVCVRTAAGGFAEPEACCFDFRSADMPAGPVVCLEVHNDGPALTPDVQVRMFDPYFSTKAGGRGLGLPAVLGVVRSHNGGVQVLSAPGRGTTVRLLFAGAAVRVVAQPAPPVAPSRAAAREGGRGAVLLADDEETVLDVASRLLASVGCSVLRAQDGAAAVALFQQHAGAIRLALIDLTMPKMSGEATLRELRRLGPDLPLVLMSGYAASDVLPRFTELKLAGYLQKPFRLPALIELLQKLLPV
jgi:CheY-like chemotaxis protein